MLLLQTLCRWFFALIGVIWERGLSSLDCKKSYHLVFELACLRGAYKRRQDTLHYLNAHSIVLEKTSALKFILWWKQKTVKNEISNISLKSSISWTKVFFKKQSVLLMLKQKPSRLKKVKKPPKNFFNLKTNQKSTTKYL